MNADALLRGFHNAGPVLQGRVHIWPNGDSLQIAHDLAAHSPSVVLVSGTSRKLLGNAWFGDRAGRAIDENLHRRSWTLSAMSYVLNDYRSFRRPRRPEDLADRVDRLGGCVVEVSDIGDPAPSLRTRRRRY